MKTLPPGTPEYSGAIILVHNSGVAVGTVLVSQLDTEKIRDLAAGLP